jgi:hypothetical protein
MRRFTLERGFATVVLLGVGALLSGGIARPALGDGVTCIDCNHGEPAPPPDDPTPPEPSPDPPMPGRDDPGARGTTCADFGGADPMPDCMQWQEPFCLYRADSGACCTWTCRDLPNAQPAENAENAENAPSVPVPSRPSPPTAHAHEANPRPMPPEPHKSKQAANQKPQPRAAPPGPKAPTRKSPALGPLSPASGATREWRGGWMPADELAAQRRDRERAPALLAHERSATTVLGGDFGPQRPDPSERPEAVYVSKGEVPRTPDPLRPNPQRSCQGCVSFEQHVQQALRTNIVLTEPAKDAKEGMSRLQNLSDSLAKLAGDAVSGRPVDGDKSVKEALQALLVPGKLVSFSREVTPPGGLSSPADVVQKMKNYVFPEGSYLLQLCRKSQNCGNLDPTADDDAN